MRNEPDRGRHRFDPGAFLVGLFFLGIAVTHLNGVVDHPVDLVILTPVTLGGLVLVLLIMAVVRVRRNRR